MSALTAQRAFLNNFKDIVNKRVDIQKDIKRYQDTLSYASSKVYYSVGENIYMLPSDMNLNIMSGTAGYNNKILVSDGKFSLGKSDKVNTLQLAVPIPKIIHKYSQPTNTHKNLEQEPLYLNYHSRRGKLPWYFLWLGLSEYGMLFDKKKTKSMSG